MIERIFEKHMNVFRYGCHKASLDHFLETGVVSGSLLMAIREMAAEMTQANIDRGWCRQQPKFPDDAHSFEVFAIKNGEAFIGYKLRTGCFHFEQVPYTGGDM